jgi:hypothetical protein
MISERWSPAGVALERGQDELSHVALVEGSGEAHMYQARGLASTQHLKRCDGNSFLISSFESSMRKFFHDQVRL